MTGDPKRQIEAHVARELSAQLFVLAFPFMLTDAVRRSHPFTFHQLRLIENIGGPLAPGLEGEDVHVVVTSAWLNLSGQPAILRPPPPSDRYWNITLIDSGGEPFASLGPALGNGDGALLLAGPNWTGEAPAQFGHRCMRAPSESVWVISRIHPRSALDRNDALALAGRQHISLLGQTDEPVPSRLEGLPPVQNSSLRDVTEMQPATFFHRLQNILDKAPAKARKAIAPLIADLRDQLGGPPPHGEWSEAFGAALAAGFHDAVAEIRAAAAPIRIRGEAWQEQYPPPGYSDCARARAARAFKSLGRPAREDMLSLVCDQDSLGQPLSGACRYRLVFPPGMLPPAKACWWLQPNPSAPGHQRHALGDRSDLALEPDGSLEIAIQQDPPHASLIQNWLPVTDGALSLVVHLHAPAAAAIQRDWRMPPVRLLQPGPADHPNPPYERRRAIGAQSSSYS